MTDLKFSELFKIHFIKRISAVLVTVFCVAFFGLYYVGVFDISFIDRPKSWEGNLDEFISALTKSYKTPPLEDDPAEPEPEPEPSDTDATDPSKPNRPRPNGGNQEGDGNEKLTFDFVSSLKEAGYRLSDKVWDQSCVFAILDTPYELPQQYTYSKTTYDKEVFTTYDDGRETTRDVVRDVRERRALETYMGYIIYDDFGKLYLISPDGGIMCRYDDSQYIPAYTRDKEGRPLFYRERTDYLEYPTEKGEADENGDKEWLQTAELTVKSKEYYYLSANGQSFVKSDYNDATDNRGLYFDYPTYYGTGDSNLSRYCLNTTAVFTPEKGDTVIENRLRWLFSSQNVNLVELKFDRYGKNLLDENGDDLKTMFPYTKAYNYTGGYATVMCDIKWDYYHDKKNEDGTTENEYVEVTSNELRIVDRNGNIMFDSRKNYYSELGWTANERFVEPLSRTIDSLGSYYFDHGYMRLRAQSYDRFYFTDLDTVFIVSDEDILVDPRGNQYHIPSGYKLVSYSDGIMLLEKDGLYGYMNIAGVWIRKPDMKYAAPFLEGVAVCTDNSGSYGVIGTGGKTLIPFNYDYISTISGGTVTAYSESGGWTIYQKLTNG